MTCELDNVVRPPSENTSNSASESELLERIRNLERLVKSQTLCQDGTVKPHHQSPETPLQQRHNLTESPENETLENDIAYLESIYSNDELLVGYLTCSSGASFDNPQKSPQLAVVLSNKVVFKFCPISQITNAPAYINRSTTSFQPVRCIWLPQYSEAQILLDKYIQDIDHVHHFVHTPSLPDLLSRGYACLSVPGSVNQSGGGLIFLFLGIFASATNSWTHPDCDRGLLSSCTEANAQVQLWVKALEDVLDITHRTVGVSMEGIQGISIAAFVVLNMSGYSRRFKALFNMAVLLARDAGLHVLDHPSHADSANLARTEIGRRLWWYLVASDWYVSP